jgi:hypothetical protein
MGFATTQGVGICVKIAAAFSFRYAEFLTLAGEQP